MKEKKTMRKWIVLSIVALVIAGGCVSMSKLVTPAALDSRAIDYTFAAGIAEPNDYQSFFWPNLADAEKLQDDVNAAHQVKQLAFQQEIDTDNMLYAQLIESVTAKTSAAKKREAAIFGVEGLLPLALTSLGFGGLAGVVAWMRKRPQDYTESDVAAIKESLVSSGVITEKALTETVKAIEKYKAIAPMEWQKLLPLLSQQQSTGSRVEIAKIRAVES